MLKNENDIRKFIFYDEAVNLIKEHLDTLPDIKAWCKNHGFNYNTVINLRNNSLSQKGTRLPELVLKMLKAMNLEVTMKKETVYFFEIYLDQK